MIYRRFSSRAEAVEWAAEHVRYRALWLRDVEWPIPLEDISRVVRELEDAARACAPSRCGTAAPSTVVSGIRAAAATVMRDCGALVSSDPGTALPSATLEALVTSATALADIALCELRARRDADRGER